MEGTSLRPSVRQFRAETRNGNSIFSARTRACPRPSAHPRSRDREMSTSISVSNYMFQGQVLSPAFSPPPSPESDDGDSDSDGDTLEAGKGDIGDKPEESGRKRRMSSPPPPPPPPRQHQFVNKKPKFQTKYHAALQPLSPCTTLSVRSSRPAPPPANRVINVQRQEEFHKLMRGCDIDKIETFLRAHSENIDINKFSEAGETALHSACQEGNVVCAKVLLKFGANPRLSTRSGFSLFHLAAFAGSPEILSLVTEVRKSY